MVMPGPILCFGDGGSDTLSGGADNDLLDGGAGNGICCSVTKVPTRLFELEATIYLAGVLATMALRWRCWEWQPGWWRSGSCYTLLGGAGNYTLVGGRRQR